jgi:hypothetical protein
MSPRPSIAAVASAGVSAEARVAAYEWQMPAGELDNFGCAVLPKLLSPVECRAIAALYPDEIFSEATFTWRGTVSARGSTATSNILFPNFSATCARYHARAILAWCCIGPQIKNTFSFLFVDERAISVGPTTKS